MNAIQRALRIFHATAEQRAAVDRILEGQPAIQPTLPALGRAEAFDQVEQRLSLALDALLDAIDAYREEKEWRKAP